ncbi:hypothetical protein [Thalassotalea euphylliae]|nr:hypothetical protein [Thalassotalea euphylliae]
MSKFSIKSNICPDSSEITYTTFYDGKKCQHQEVTGKIAKRRLALEYIVRDLSSCFEYLHLLKSCQESEIAKPIYDAFVIKYGKCFASGNERGLSLKPKNYFQNESMFYKTHLNIIKTRNKYVAHSDSSVYEQGEVYLATNGSESKVFIPVINYSHPTDKSLDREIELCKHLTSKVVLEIQKLDSKIKA